MARGAALTGVPAARARPLVLGKYQPVARLATGGMAEILLARRRGAGGFEKLVVLKRLLPHLAEQRHLVEMFLDEARIAASISHPHVCQVFELDEEDDRYIIVMEYLEGVTMGRLAQGLGPRGPNELALIVELGRQAAMGLHHAHELVGPDGASLGLVHRDVSPSNLLVTAAGILKVLDFGIAKTRLSTAHTKTGLVKGKTGYMSPEQVRSRPLDRRSDVFSLAVVLHEAVTGAALFRKDSDFDAYRAILDEPAQDLRTRVRGVPAVLAEAIGDALAKDREARPATAAALARRLEAAAAALGTRLSPADIAERMERRFGAEIADRRRRIAGALEAQSADEAPTEVRELPTVPTDGGDDGRSDDRDPGDGRDGDGRDGDGRDGRDHGDGDGRAEVRRRAGLSRDGDGVTRTAARPGPGSRVADGETAAVVFRRRRRAWLGIGAGAIVAAVVIMIGLAFLGMGPSPQGARSSAVDAALPSIAPPDAGAALLDDARAAASEPSGDASPVPVPEGSPARSPRPKERPTAPGYFTVDSRPWATIYVDGKKLGVTPLLRVPLSPGSHVLRAVSQTGREQRFKVVIESGKEAPRRRLVW
jgi:serine/threonine-protein kinase